MTFKKSILICMLRAFNYVNLCPCKYKTIECKKYIKQYKRIEKNKKKIKKDNIKKENIIYSKYYKRILS